MRGPLIYLLLIVAIFFVAQSVVNTDNQKDAVLGYTEFLQKVSNGEITDITIVGYEAVALKEGSSIKEDAFPKKYDYYVYLPSYYQVDVDLKAALGVANLAESKVEIVYEPIEDNSFLLDFVLPYLVPILLMGFLWFMMYRQTQGGGKAMNYGKSRAKMTMGQNVNKTFADVAGADEEKAELEEIVQFLKDPKQFTKMGARIPKGVLLVGPPGCGKTLLAKAVAGEAKIPFFSITGSDFVEMFVGMGAARVRDLFDNAKKNSPCIIFIDEIDAVGRQRGAGLGGGHDEREQTLNQLLVEMDGFIVNEGIIVLAATNRVDILDPALLRAGRFDRQIVVNVPDVKGREDILKVHAKGKPLGSDVDLKVIAKRTPGFSGADLENVLNEAAILAARFRKNAITMAEVEEAITRVIAGPEKKSRVITEKDKMVTAYHEVGHAICAKVLPNCDEVHEISIIPRGMAAGYTMTLPNENENHYFKSKMVDEMTMMLGGRAAEALVLGDITTGASNDIERATNMAKAMIVKYGMNEQIGPVFHGNNQEVFLGKEIVQSKSCSEEVSAQIDAELKKQLTACMDKATEILRENMSKLHSISKALMEKEKLTGEEFEELFNAPDMFTISEEQ
ncbi:MAG: ATP-dependent zinc metalloprotease FtsH [Clostridia bacterium]|nr:ATP-dependent zinc metalloprotease FtsH [Clostridia bacterium]